jgi:hypothetical protein
MVAFYISLASYYSFLVWDFHYKVYYNVNIGKQNKDFISFLRPVALLRLSASTFAASVSYIYENAVDLYLLVGMLCQKQSRAGQRSHTTYLPLQRESKEL